MLSSIFFKKMSIFSFAKLFIDAVCASLLINLGPITQKLLIFLNWITLGGDF